MKRAYTASAVLSLTLLVLSYSRLTGTGSSSCTRQNGFAGMYNSTPNTNCAAACHGGGAVVSGPTTNPDTVGMVNGTDTTSTGSGSGTSGGTTGLADIAFRSAISVYPTVTTGQFCIATTEQSQDMITYGVFALDGRLIGAGMLPEYAAVSHLNISTLPAAQYIVRVSAGGLSASYHLIKQ